jgi:hypothetical protein
VLGIVACTFAAIQAVSSRPARKLTLAPSIITEAPVALDKSEARPLDAPIDTLKNDDELPTSYWYGAGSDEFAVATRLTAVNPCTLNLMRVAKRRIDTTVATVAMCTLVVYNDDFSSGSHQPGTVIRTYIAKDSVPRFPSRGWLITYNIIAGDTLFLMPGDYWFGWRSGHIAPTDSIFFPMSDTSVNAEPLSFSNLISTTSTEGPWDFYIDCDWRIRAIVARFSGDVHNVAAVEASTDDGFFLPNPGTAAISGRFTNIGSAAETDVPVACTVYTEAGTAVWNTSATIPSLAVGETATVDFTPSWTSSTDGAYHIMVRSLVPGDLQPANDRALREAYICSSPAELRYDDNSTMDNAWAYYDSLNCFASKFVPPYYPAKLTAVKYGIWDATWPVPGGDRMIARILKDDGTGGLPGTVLYEAPVTVTRGVWNEVTLPTPLTVNSGAFYVAYVQRDTYPDCPALATDTHEPFAFQAYACTSGVWYYEPRSSEWMIRAKIEKPTPPPPTDTSWVSLPDVPLSGKNKKVKDGTALAYCEEHDTDFVYLLKGNNTYAFHKFNTEGNTWALKESIPAIGSTGKKKSVKKGSSLAQCQFYDKLYATKGNNTIEFWEYDPAKSGTPNYPWAEKAAVPLGAKACKEAVSSVAVQSGDTNYIYLLKGSGTQEFYRYNTLTNTWETMLSAPSGLSGKPYKKGSKLAVAEDGKTIYLLKGSYNELYAYDVTTNAWTTKTSLPLIGASGKKKKAGDGSSMAYHAGIIYTLKGNNTQEYWNYLVDSSRWVQGADFPLGGGKKVKAGGALVYVASIHALVATKGNNTQEFYKRGVPAFAFATPDVAQNATGKRTELMSYGLLASPNPFNNVLNIAFSLPKSGNVSLRLYDVTGSVVTTIANGFAPAGSYNTRIDGSKLSRGIYLLKFESEGYRATQKLILE